MRRLSLLFLFLRKPSSLYQSLEFVSSVKMFNRVGYQDHVVRREYLQTRNAVKKNLLELQSRLAGKSLKIACPKLFQTCLGTLFSSENSIEES